MAVIVTSLNEMICILPLSVACFWPRYDITGDPLHSRALAHSRAPLFTQPCSHCSHSRAPGEQWARLCVFTLHGCVQAARLCRGSPVDMVLSCYNWRCCSEIHLYKLDYNINWSFRLLNNILTYRGRWRIYRLFGAKRSVFISYPYHCHLKNL